MASAAIPAAPMGPPAAATTSVAAQEFWTAVMEEGSGRAVDEDKVVYVPSPDPSN